MSNIDPLSEESVPVTPPAPAVPATGSESPHRPPDDVEEVYYEGSPMVRGAIGRDLLWSLIGCALIALVVVKIVLGWNPTWWPWWVSVLVVLVGVGLFFIPVLMSKSIRYRVTNYRIDYERGILSKNIDTMELWHVEDLSFHQSLIDRILGVGNVIVLSHDETMPKLVLASVPNPRHLYEQLKQRVIAVKRQRGVIKMDPG